MELTRFAELVGEMRRLQRRYFRIVPEHRPPGLLGRAKAAERAVDEALERVRCGQQWLFPLEGVGEEKSQR